MNDFLTRYAYVWPGLVGALVTLIVGYIVARIVGGVVTGVLQRTGLERRLAGLVARPGQARPVNAAPVVGRIVFWLIMLFVLVAFFQALSLTIITGPLIGLLALLLGYLPLLIGAVILLLVAWIVATILRTLVLRAAEALRLDERVSGGAPPAGQPLSRPLSEAVYWLVFLLFLPAILGTLGLTGLLVPVQLMLNNLLGFLPHILAAALLLLIGWFVARLVSRIVASLLAAVGVDAFSERIGLAGVLGTQRLSRLIGLVIYILILLPVVISALDALQLGAITAPASSMLNSILLAIPRIFAAGLTLLIFYMIGRVLAPIGANLLAGAGADTWPARLGLGGTGTQQPALSVLGGRLIMAAFLLFGVLEVLQLLAFTELAALVMDLTRLAGHIVLGLIILAIGLWLARLAAGAVMSSDMPNARTLAEVARWAILILIGAMGLRYMGLAPEIINLAFGLLLGSVAVASAVAFGVGGRHVAGRELERFVERRRASAIVQPGTPEEPAVIVADEIGRMLSEGGRLA